MNKRSIVVLAIASVLPLASSGGFAEEAYKKFRFSLTVSNFSTQDEIRSNADNVSLWKSDLGGLETVDDPRPDAAVRNTNSISDNVRYDFQASYGLLRWKWGELTIDSSVGYFKGDLGDLELAGQFDIVDPPRATAGELVRYHLFYIPIGRVTEVPVQVGGTLRFRPRKALSPYVGLGAGYLFAKIDSTEDFDTFSRNVFKSQGAYSYPVGGGAATQGPLRPLKAAEATAPDCFEFYASGGLEYTVAKGLTVFVSGLWMWASDEIDITIDGKHNFGTALPNGETKFKYPKGGLPVIIPAGYGGLVDFGSGFPYVDPITGIHYVGAPDGYTDSGAYYAQGGNIRYNGFEIGLGVRYQF